MRPANGAPKLRLILVHASISGYEAYRPLVENIDNNIEIYGIDSYNLYAQEDELIKDSNTLVNLYVSQIENELIDKSIPICLGGWSLGGLMANFISSRLALNYRVIGLIGLDAVFYDDAYAELFMDDALHYFMDIEKLLLQTDSSKEASNIQVRLSNLLKVERSIAKSIVQIMRDTPVLNIIASKTRHDIPDLKLSNLFNQLKKDNGWKLTNDDQVIFIDCGHEQIVGANLAKEISGYINQYLEKSCSII